MKMFRLMMAFCAAMIIIFTKVSGFAQDAAEAPQSVKDVVMIAPENLQEVAQEQWNTAKGLMEKIIEFVVTYFFQAVGGVIVLVLGWLVAKYIANWVNKFLKLKNIDITVAKFICAAAKFMVMTFAVIVALGKFGIEIAPLIAGISVAGFGLSFALQGPLSNYAAGATLIFTKPFKVGDIIEVAGVDGEVLDLKLPRTEIRTVDGETIVVPNKHIIGEIIQNNSSWRRLDVTVGVSYKADIQKAIDIVRGVVESSPLIVKDKTPKIGISEFADSSVNIYARMWTKQDNFWDAKFSINKAIWDEFQGKGIEIPFPQRDVHLFKHES